MKHAQFMINNLPGPAWKVMHWERATEKQTRCWFNQYRFGYGYSATVRLRGKQRRRWRKWLRRVEYWKAQTAKFRTFKTP